jgi:sugar phosphate isomerase/epimerase
MQLQQPDAWSVEHAEYGRSSGAECMAPRFSLAHLTVLGCSPAEMTYIAADAGYDLVSFRIMALELPGEPRYPLARDKAMLRETKTALTETGLELLDVEVARISDDRDVRDYRPSLEVAAELGAKHVIACCYGKDRGRLVSSFAQLCQLAAPLGLTVDLEFITFSDISTLGLAYGLVREAGCSNGGILIDTLHFDRAQATCAELGAISPSLFRFAQLCDAPKALSPSRDDLIRTAREERLYLGEGDIPVKEIMAHLPDIPCSLEIAHRTRQQELGYGEFARQCLATARRYFEDASP